MKIGDIKEKRFTSDAVAAAAGCSEATLRQWRNRYKFLKDTVTGGMEVKKFSLLDICVVRAVKVMTDYGLGAADAVWVAYHPRGVGQLLRSLLSEVEGTPTLLGIQPGNRDKNEKFSFIPFWPKQFAATMDDSDGIMIVFDLNVVIQHVRYFFDPNKT